MALILANKGIADHFGVTTETIRVWRQDEVVRRVALACEVARAEASARLRVLTAAAVATLEEALTCEEPAVRVRAAGEILDRAGVSRTSKVEQRARRS